MTVVDDLQLVKTLDQLRDEEMIRRTLEAAARCIEQQSGNEVYERAWKRAAELVRSMKP